MKTRLLLVSSLLALAASLVGCSKQTLVQDRLEIKYPDELLFLPTGGEQSLVITFNDKWQLNAPGWAHCSHYSGSEGTFTLQITADVNRTGQDQSGYLDFKCSDGTTVSLPVNQPCPFLKISFSDDAISSPVEGNSKDALLTFNWNDSQNQGGRAVTVKVESNVDWRFDFKEFSTPENEFVLSKDHGFGSAELKLIPRRNNVDKKAYECLLTADAYMPGEHGEIIGEGVDSYSFALCQKNLRFLLNDNTDDVDYIVDELGETTISINVDSELPWNVSGNTEWVKMNATSGDAGVSQIILQTGVNPSREERSKDIVLHSSGGAERVIRFRQSPFVFSLDKQEVTLDNEGQTTAILNISSSGPWSVKGPEWLTVSASGQDGNGTLTLSCEKQNLDLTELKGVVRLTSQLNSLVEEAAVSQEAFIFEVIPDEAIKKIPALSMNQYPLSIHSSGKWSLSTSQSWVNLSTKSGEKDGVVYVNSNSYNPDLNKDRNATLTIVSETHKAKGITLKKEIPLTQTKFLFSITPSTTNLPAYSASSSFSLDVVCSQDWEIVSCPEWLIPEAKSGTFDKNLSFTVSPNTNKTSRRSGKIRVRSVYNNAYLETATITQDMFVFNLSQSSFTNLPPVNVGAKSITINCSDEVPWEVINSDDWLTLNTVSGIGTSTIIVTPKDNPKTATRSSTFSIRNSVSNEKLNVTFAQKAFVFSVTGNTFSFDELDTSQKTITIDCSSSWTIDVGNASWINLSTSSGTGKQTVNLGVKKNIETEKRNATITVYSDLQRGTSDELKKTINVEQAAFIFDSSSETFSGLDAVNETGFSQSVNVTCSGEWGIESSVDWLKFSPSEGSGNGSLRFSQLTNPNLSDRSTSFSIYSKDNPNLKKKVNVTQNAYIFSVDSQKMEFTSAAGNKTCNIRSSAKWTATASQSWISVSAREGSGNQALTISVEKNSTKNDRTGKVTISSEYGSHVLTIDISQQKP